MVKLKGLLKPKYVHRDIVVRYDNLRLFRQLWLRDFKKLTCAPNFFIADDGSVWVSYNEVELRQYCKIYKFNPYVSHKEYLHSYFDMNDRIACKYYHSQDTVLNPKFSEIPRDVFYKKNFGPMSLSSFDRKLRKEMKVQSEKYYNDPII